MLLSALLNHERRDPRSAEPLLVCFPVFDMVFLLQAPLLVCFPVFDMGFLLQAV